jgi:hypothetical protein
MAFECCKRKKRRPTGTRSHLPAQDGIKVYFHCERTSSTATLRRPELELQCLRRLGKYTVLRNVQTISAVVRYLLKLASWYLQLELVIDRCRVVRV